MQTLLEKQGIESRKENINNNNVISPVLGGYNKNDEYSSIHKNALSDGDVQGKGTSNGGHTHTFTTSNAGSGNSGNLQPYITVYMWKRTA